MVARLDPESFGFLLNDVTRLNRAEFDRRTSEAGLGLTPGDGRTLAYAARMGSVRQNVLAERIGVEAMTLSTALDRLEARGLVLRQPDPADRRAKLVQLTAAGEEVLTRIQPVSAGLRKDVSAGIDAADWERLMEMLRQVRANLQEMRADQRRDNAA
jgi:MarR family transcriptional regulator, transcriptional regulator for hemolysin